MQSGQCEHSVLGFTVSDPYIRIRCPAVKDAQEHVYAVWELQATLPFPPPSVVCLHLVSFSLLPRQVLFTLMFISFSCICVLTLVSSLSLYLR